MIKNCSGNDLEKAAAIDNDETMIINDDLSIITTPIESPQDMAGSSKRSPQKKQQIDSDETLTSDTSTSEAVEKNKRHRPKARSESNRSEKYAKEFLFCFYCYPIGCFISIHLVLHFSTFSTSLYIV